MNLCRACGEDFSSVEGFDRHRVGIHEYTHSEGLRSDPPVEDGRRCLYVHELEALGFTKNAAGRWHDPVRVSQTRESLRGRQRANAKRTGPVVKVA